MRVSFGAALCALLWLGMPSAYAEPASDSVQINAPQAMRLAPGEFDTYAASYLLSNGQRIAFSQRGQRYFVRLDGESGMEILPRARGVFSSVSGARIEFSATGDSLTIRYYERLASSMALPAGTLLQAAR